MASASVSKSNLILEIRGKTKLSCEFKRHLSPRTVGQILRNLPLEGNAHSLGSDIVYMETIIESGIERKKTEFKRGDITFLPASGSICFIFNDTISSKVMTPIGKIISQTDVLREIKPGDVFLLYHADG